MATKDKSKEADFATLAEKFLELEQEEFGGPAQGDAAAWREQIAQAIGTARLHREQLGVLLVHGRKHFKKDRVWLHVKKAVATAAGYRSPRSIETLMDDATRARELRNASAHRYDALERCGVVAAETRWAKLIEQLSKDIPENETAEEAQKKVKELHEAFKPPKKSGEASGGSKIERLNGKIERLIVQLFGQVPKDQREVAIQQIIAEATKKADDAAIQKSAAASTQTQNPANSQPVLVVARADKDGTAMIGLPNSTGTRLPVLAGAHPWGDAFLGSLVPGPRSLEPQGYDEKAIHRAYGDKLAKRFFVGDIFAPGFSDYIVSRHIESFQKADWHTYLVLSANIRRMLDFCNRADAQELPESLWIGASITSSSAFDQIEALVDLDAPNKWVSFLPFKSGKPIREASPALEEVLRNAGIRWVVFGGYHIYDWEMTGDDEQEIVRAGHAAGCPVYCTSTQTMEDLVRRGTVEPGNVPGLFRHGERLRDTWKLRELPDFTHTPLSLSA